MRTLSSCTALLLAPLHIGLRIVLFWSAILHHGSLSLVLEVVVYHIWFCLGTMACFCLSVIATNRGKTLSWTVGADCDLDEICWVPDLLVIYRNNPNRYLDIFRGARVVVREPRIDNPDENEFDVYLPAEAKKSRPNLGCCVRGTNWTLILKNTGEMLVPVKLPTTSLIMTGRVIDVHWVLDAQEEEFRLNQRLNSGLKIAELGTSSRGDGEEMCRFCLRYHDIDMARSCRCGLRYIVCQQ